MVIQYANSPGADRRLAQMRNRGSPQCFPGYAFMKLRLKTRLLVFCISAVSCAVCFSSLKNEMQSFGLTAQETGGFPWYSVVKALVFMVSTLAYGCLATICCIPIAGKKAVDEGSY